MDTRKTTLIITIAVIALVSVGIGFAYVAYTSNSGNNTDVAYITLTQEDGQTHAKYTFTGDNAAKVKFDTFNTSTDTYYKLNADDAITMDKAGFPGYKFVDLGNVTLVASYEGTGAKPSPLHVTIIASENFEASDSWVYFLTDKYTVTDKTTTDIKIYAYKNNLNGSWINGPDALDIVTDNQGNYNKAEVHLCYGYPTAIATKNFDTQIEELKGFLRSTAVPDELDDASVIFKATESATTIKETKVVTYTDNTLTYVVLVEKGTSYTLFANNNTTLFDVPPNMQFGGWLDDQEQEVTEPQTITADTTYHVKWIAA